MSRWKEFLVALLVCIVVSAGQVRAETYTLSINPTSISMPQGWTQSIYVTETTTNASIPPPSIALQMVSSSGVFNLGYNYSTIFTSATTIVYQFNISVPSGDPVGTLPAAVIENSTGTVSTQPLFVTVTAATSSWPTVAPVHYIDWWIPLPTLNSPGVGSVLNNTAASVTVPVNTWVLVKSITVPTLGNNAPAFHFDLTASVPCAPLLEDTRSGSVVSWAEDAEYSTQWNFTTYLANVQAGDVVKLYALSQTATSITNNYLDLYY